MKLEIDFEKLATGYAPVNHGLKLETWDVNWPEEPEPLEETNSELPEVKPEDVPEFLREYTLSCSRRACFAIEYLTIFLYSILASLIGRKLALKPRKKDNWIAIPTFWGMGIGRSSVKKSPALDAAMKFLEALDDELMEPNLQAQAEWNAERLILEEEKNQLLKSLKSRNKDVPQSEVRENVKEKLAEIEYKIKNCKPPFRKLFVVDATKEKIVEILKDNPHGFLLNRDELAGLFASFSMKGREQDRSFYLGCANGDSPYSEERKTRESVYLKALILSISGTIQPGVIAYHIRGANDGAAGADGLMARFTGAVFPRRPKFIYVDEAPNSEEFDKILNGLRRLRDLEATQFGVEEKSKSGVPFIGFDDEAQAIFKEWLIKHEEKLENGKFTEGLEAHLGKYAKGLCTLAIIFHMLSWLQKPVGADIGSVETPSLLLAIRWMDILEAHAVAIYNGAGNSKKVSAALLMDKIDNGEVKHLDSIRDIYRNGWTGLGKKELVLEACSELSRRGYLKVINIPLADQPWINSEKIALHPSLRG